MNQFFLVWPTWAIQTPCVRTWSEGVFCFRKKPQSKHGTSSLYTLVFMSIVCFLFKGFVLQNTTMYMTPKHNWLHYENTKSQRENEPMATNFSSTLMSPVVISLLVHLSKEAWRKHSGECFCSSTLENCQNNKVHSSCFYQSELQLPMSLVLTYFKASFRTRIIMLS